LKLKDSKTCRYGITFWSARIIRPIQ